MSTLKSGPAGGDIADVALGAKDVGDQTSQLVCAEVLDQVGADSVADRLDRDSGHRVNGRVPEACVAVVSGQWLRLCHRMRGVPRLSRSQCQPTL
jgi:hypothetical protein